MTSDTHPYQASPIRRSRRSRAEMDAIRAAIVTTANAGDGMTVRHLFYRLVAQGVVEKSEPAYDQIVVRLALEMRRDGSIPFGKIVDGSRLYTMPDTFNGVHDAIAETARLYRRSYWRNADRTLECWVEKDAIRGLIDAVTWKLAVPLMVTRGFCSESIVQDLAYSARRSGRPKVILFLNDYDPSGSLMLNDILRRAKHYAPGAVFHTEQVALVPEQIEQFRLPTRPTKRDGNNHARRFQDDRSVELDAVAPDDLRQILQRAIEAHIDPAQLAVIEAAEQSERGILLDMASGLS
jgi:hypothetical protein